MDSPVKYEFRFKRDPNATVHLTHGVWGGLNQQSQIEMDFFSESEDLPEKIDSLIARDGTVLSEETVYNDPSVRHITRTIHSRIVLSLEAAQAISAWLLEHIEMGYANLEASEPEESSPIDFSPTKTRRKQ